MTITAFHVHHLRVPRHLYFNRLASCITRHSADLPFIGYWDTEYYDSLGALMAIATDEATSNE